MVKKMMPVLVFLLLLAACSGKTSQIQSPQNDQQDSTPLEQTKPSPAQPAEPEPAAVETLPGVEIIPIETMEKGIPWLAEDETAVPVTSFIGINSSVPPFDNPLVRKAFSLAIDRQRISDGEKSRGNEFSLPATTFIPPQVLGQDLFQSLGLGFDADAAKKALTDAGYSDISQFPNTGIVFYEGSMELVKAYQEMWQNNLGVDVALIPIKSGEELYKYIDEQKPGLFILGVWIADYIDPKNFTFDVFLSPDSKYPEIRNPKLTEILAKAEATASDPLARQRLYIEAEKLICENEVLVIPVTHSLISK